MTGAVGFRLVEPLRAAYGVTLLVAPDLVLGRLGVRSDATSRAVARVLGARHVAQATLSGFRPSPEVLAMGVWVDVAHAGSALALAVADHERARAGLVDTVVAGVWAASSYRDLRHGHATRPSHERRRDRLAVAVLSRVPGGGSLLRTAEDVRRRDGGTSGAAR